MSRSDTVKVIVDGAAGRMGRTVVNLIPQMGMEMVGAVEEEGHPQMGNDAGQVAGLDTAGIEIVADLRSVIDAGDVVVEFTTPEATMAHLRLCVHSQKPMVIGTTGLDEGSLGEIEGAGKAIPCVLAPNMSLGANLVMKLVGEMAGTLGEDYDVEIVEAHHRFKKDAPSGTARRLALLVAKALGRELEDIGVLGREGLVGERKRGEIGIHAVRAGDIVGEHTVIFGGLGERIELIHRVHSRETFARGALMAAKFVVAAESGIYDMQDVLGLI